MATLCSAAKFREETSKKADSAVRDRIAAMHNLADRLFACKRYFAMQHCFARFSRQAASDARQPFAKSWLLSILPMRRFGLVFAMLLGVCGLSLAQEIRVASLSQQSRPRGMLCRSAVAAAERGNDIPAHLLAAISRVESGRRDPVSGAVHPWPWTVNAEGQGSFYDTKAAGGRRGAGHAGARHAIDRCRLRADQPDAPSGRLPEPGIGIRPAGQCRLRGEVPAGAVTRRPATGTKATAHVSLGDARAGRRYQRKVLAVWPEEQRLGRRSPERRRWRRPGAPRCHAPVRLQRAPHAAARDGSRTADHHAAYRRWRCAARPRAGRLSGSTHRSRLPATTAAPRRRVASGGEFGADCGGVLADRRHRPNARGPSLNSTGGAASDTGPFGVSTAARRSAGWREKAATSLTKP